MNKPLKLSDTNNAFKPIYFFENIMAGPQSIIPKKGEIKILQNNNDNTDELSKENTQKLYIFVWIPANSCIYALFFHSYFLPLLPQSSITNMKNMIIKGQKREYERPMIRHHQQMVIVSCFWLCQCPKHLFPLAVVVLSLSCW
jgi:hypothetical protein